MPARAITFGTRSVSRTGSSTRGNPPRRSASAGPRDEPAAAPRSGSPAARTSGARRTAMRPRASETLPRGRRARIRASRRTGGVSTTTPPRRAARSLRRQSGFESAGHRRECAVRVPQRGFTGGPQGVELAPAAAALGRRLAGPRTEESLPLQTFERRVDRVNRDVASGSAVDLLADRRAVRFVDEAEHAEQDELFEI